MTLHEVREKYIDFMRKKGHVIVHSTSLIPENDPTTLFTGSGMQPMTPYLLGEKHPNGVRVANSQRCFRAEDIEEVGDNRHTTFFEMLGNWSFGDYFKKEQLEWISEFLFDEIKIDLNKIYISVFAGDIKNNLKKDTESAELWENIFQERGVQAKSIELGSVENAGSMGMQGGRIFYYDSKKNWWSRSGSPDKMPIGEIGGPDSEIFHEFTEIQHDKKFGENCHPNCDCGRFFEIGNNVFMTYKKVGEGKFDLLPKKNVDFGGGLERITAASNNTADIFKIDVFENIIRVIERLSGSSYSDENKKQSFRIVSDHIRAVIFLVCDDVYPSNVDRGYFVRRLTRRALIHWDRLGVNFGGIGEFVDQVSDYYKEAYPALSDKKEQIKSEIKKEEEKFRNTLEKGLKEFEKLSNSAISGREAFILFSSYGFPIELTLEIAKDRNIKVDLNGFKKEMEKHQETSRQGAEHKFKGGLADNSEMSVKYHTATHLLHQALRTVLGNHVLQKGSNITPERLRFDFSHDSKMTTEEKQRVEGLVNEQIKMGLDVTYQDSPLEEAKKLGAIGLFEEKYGDTVRVYKVGDFSLEFCGGPHVKNTKELGSFKIIQEESVATGVRRIKAILQ